MSPVLQKPAQRGKSAAAPRTVALGLPQVNLLPPEIRSTRALATVKRWLVIALVIVVALVGAVYAFALIDRGSASNELVEADAETVRLRAEERKYAEVPQVLDAISSTTTARSVAMGDEVLWKGYIDAIAAVLPADVSIDSFQVSGPSPLSSAAGVSNPLDTASVGAITFVARSRTVPKTADWLDALGTVPGFTSPWASTLALAEIEGSVYYSVSMTVDLTDVVFAHRFDAAAQEDS